MSKQTSIGFNISGIYWSTVVVAITVIPFIIMSKKYDSQGFIAVLFVVLVLFCIYLITVFIRTYFPAIVLYDEYIRDNHRMLRLSRIIYKKDITSVSIQETLHRGGRVRYIAIMSSKSDKPLLLFDDRLTVTLDELFQMIETWRNSPEK